MTTTTTHSTEFIIRELRALTGYSNGYLGILFTQAADKLQYLLDSEMRVVSRDYYLEYLRYLESEPANEPAPTGGPDAA